MVTTGILREALDSFGAHDIKFDLTPCAPSAILLRIHLKSSDRAISSVVGMVLGRHFDAITERSTLVSEDRDEETGYYGNEFTGTYVVPEDSLIWGNFEVEMAKKPSKPATSYPKPKLPTRSKRKGR